MMMPGKVLGIVDKNWHLILGQSILGGCDLSKERIFLQALSASEVVVMRIEGLRCAGKDSHAEAVMLQLAIITGH